MRDLRSIRAFTFFLMSFFFSQLAVAQSDPLPSWREGPAKQRIITFVESVTEKTSPDFVAVEERIASFDNDGTLWQEKPIVQAVFVLSRLRALSATQADIQADPLVQRALSGGASYLSHASKEELTKILALTHAHMTQDKFEEEGRSFLETARHPKFDKLYTELTYRPMLELVAYLHAKSFQVYISSGGGVDFMRLFSSSLYGIPSERVIGSSVVKVMQNIDGRDQLWRLPLVATVNNRDFKPIYLNHQIGKRPLFAAGNVGGKGDIAMLRYSQTYAGPSLQMLVNHDDAAREFAYQEADGASLTAAAERGWVVVSMKDDWLEIF